MGNSISEMHNINDMAGFNQNDNSIDFDANFVHNLYVLEHECGRDNTIFVQTISYWSENILALPTIKNIKLMTRLPYSTRYEPTATVATPLNIHNESLLTHCRNAAQYDKLLNYICINKLVVQRILHCMQLYDSIEQLMLCIGIMVNLIFDSHHRTSLLQSYNVLPTLLDIQVQLKIRTGDSMFQTRHQRKQYGKAYEMLCNILRLIDDTKYKQSIRFTICKGLYNPQHHQQYIQWLNHNHAPAQQGMYNNVRQNNQCALTIFATDPLFDEQLVHIIFSYIFPFDHKVGDIT